MNSHSCSIAQSPTNSAGPMLRAGFTDVLSIGMPTRWISARTSPIGIPANATSAIRSVAGEDGEDEERGQDDLDERTPRPSG